MRPRIDDTTLEHPVTRLVVREAVAAALETPLREPIVDAVDDAGAGPSTDVSNPDAGKSRFVAAAQGLAAFAVLFVALYATLRRLTGETEA